MVLRTPCSQARVRYKPRWTAPLGTTVTLELQDGTNTKGSYDRVLTLTTPITIRAVNSGSAILDGASSTNGMIDITTSSSSVHVTLEGLHITNGATWYCGGGLKITMTNTQSVLNLRHCSIYGHHVGAWYYGGGACIYAGQVNFDHCQIFDNSADAGRRCRLVSKRGRFCNGHLSKQRAVQQRSS